MSMWALATARSHFDRRWNQKMVDFFFHVFADERLYNEYLCKLKAQACLHWLLSQSSILPNMPSPWNQTHDQVHIYRLNTSIVIVILALSFISSHLLWRYKVWERGSCRMSQSLYLHSPCDIRIIFRSIFIIVILHFVAV